MAGEVSFFELGVREPGPAREFYGELFGWRMKPGPSGTFAFCRDNQGSSFGLHQPPS